MEHHIRFDADAMTLYLLDQRALPEIGRAHV